MTERLSILKRIEQALKSKTNESIFSRRSEIPKFNLFAKDASEIFVLAGNANNLLSNHLDFLESKISTGTKLKCLFLDPDDDITIIWDKYSKYKNMEARIRESLRLLNLLKPKGNCQVKVIDTFIPFTAIYLKLPKEEKILVEYFTYKTAVDSRIHFIIDKSENLDMFNFYFNQMTNMWNDSRDIR